MRSQCGGTEPLDALERQAARESREIASELTAALARIATLEAALDEARACEGAVRVRLLERAFLGGGTCGR